MKNLIKKVCVIGDVIIDQYVETKALGMSNEDPTIVVTPTDKVNYIGGSAIVAAHSSSLGAKTHLISVTGKDDSKKFLIKKLKKSALHTIYSKMKVDQQLLKEDTEQIIKLYLEFQN